ncbi:MAG TPA: hypothetical protein VNA89_11185 [Gemmatimonadaceae bacterium]|nr:hypothetical protein [Gemmatimonadaceae bacterium]
MRIDIRPLLVLLLAAGAWACTEDLDGSAACPALCPDQGIPVREIELTGVAVDTTITQYPTRGTEGLIPLITAGDSLDTRAVVRFDTVTRVITPTATGSTALPIETIDSVFVRLGLEDTLAVRPASVIIEVFDVDTTAADTNFAAVASLFRSDRLLGADTLTAAEAQDSVRIFLDATKVLDRVRAAGRVRLGVRATGEGGAAVFLRVKTLVTGTAASLFYRARADTAVRLLAHAPESRTPDEEAVRVDLVDYALYVRGTRPPGPDEIVVGGLPGRRAYLRFDVPLWLTDSTTVVRASLVLTQRGRGAGFAFDTLSIAPHLVVAGADVRDVARAASLIASASSLGVDSLLVAPEDSVARIFEIGPVLRFWANRPTSELPRAVVLRTPYEGGFPREARFFSLEAPAAVRPRLLVVYIPREPFGIP